MPRKYEDIHVCPSGDHGSVHWNCTCDPGEGERVTALDLRDVEPLVEALRHAQEVLGAESVSAEEDVQALVHVGEVLEAFEEDS